MNTSTDALGVSLARARLGYGATTPPSERWLLDHLQAAATDAGCQTPDLVTAIYVALKLHAHVVISSDARAHVLGLFDALATTIVGADSDQILRLRLHDEPLAQRYAAVRLHALISAALEPSAQQNVWFVLVDAAGAADAAQHWIDRELTAALRANDWTGPLPRNVCVLLTAHQAADSALKGWITLASPQWGVPTGGGQVRALPPVGLQRQLLNAQLTGAMYRMRLRQQPHMHGSWRLRRWLAASVDSAGRGLWHARHQRMNVARARAALGPHAR